MIMLGALFIYGFFAFLHMLWDDYQENKIHYPDPEILKKDKNIIFFY